MQQLLLPIHLRRAHTHAPNLGRPPRSPASIGCSMHAQKHSASVTNHMKSSSSRSPQHADLHALQPTKRQTEEESLQPAAEERSTGPLGSASHAHAAACRRCGAQASTLTWRHLPTVTSKPTLAGLITSAPKQKKMRKELQFL